MDLAYLVLKKLRSQNSIVGLAYLDLNISPEHQLADVVL